MTSSECSEGFSFHSFDRGGDSRAGLSQKKGGGIAREAVTTIGYSKLWLNLLIYIQSYVD